MRAHALCGQVPVLSRQHSEPDRLIPTLERFVAREPGVAAIRNGQLVGYLFGFDIGHWHGRRTVFSPAWAHAAALEDRQALYWAMYREMSRQWVAAGQFQHALVELATGCGGREAWQWMGFGLAAVDAVRSLDPATGGDPDARIRRASLDDVEVAAQLGEALWRHLCAPPVFLLRQPRDWVEVQRAFVSDSANALWLAERDGQVVASMRHAPVSDDVSYVLRDSGTTSIVGAYACPEARGRGVAVALLNQVLAQAREEGYERCGVDFETQNIEGVRFWLRHFRPVGYGMSRVVDGRAKATS